ncbi:oligopeptidase F, Metallo peptidase, MEROPS family M03B [Lactococcus cremoris subsp. cremoris SK11]|uniref:Oligopeptidase F n=12 Tax=Lactococcus lactis subsp. cremoris TaxID=1359 RepID=Q02XE6_LACLS|nr:oligoendopeptidase F [Lactococcus cremoris]ABJ73376.1 oligopeptidase F, Metallo peptidase, MEROPS family M03B [Lactococcus cremoris subsp. cremoris SK11]MRM43514.1 oligoendopeptidase F [Lactococcus cremoris]TNU87609.1 oligoendopeptidase F [Lactococcus cremoris]WGL39605.1 oligoendopeptidase F [Lactococcus cremoris]
MVKNRNEIPEALTWDLTTIFSTDQKWETELEKVKKELSLVETNDKGHLLDSAETLLTITKNMLSISQKVEKLYVYASMKNDQDTREAKYQEYQSKATALYVNFGESYAFYEPEFLKITKETYEQWLEILQELKNYDHMFERLFAKKEHILSQKEEKILAAAGEIFESPSETFEIFDNADVKFPFVKNELGEKIQLTHGNYSSLMESKNREVRKAAYEALYSNYEQYQHTYAKTLQTNVKVYNFNAQIRAYDSARQAALMSNFVPEKVYDVLIEGIHQHLPLLHRYIELRKKILGISDFKMYDIYTPLSNLDYKFNYTEGVKKAQEVLAIFGEEYSQKVKAAFEQRWIDVEENIGKRSGAYSGGSYDTNAFMLLNWQETLDDLFTLVHETGHSMHSAFTRENQPYVYGNYPIFLAEIASTTNENILTETLLKESKDDKERFALLNHWLDSFRGTVFRQSQFAEFEQKIHEVDAEGEVLTSEFLNSLYGELNEKYYGLSAKENPEIQFEWARIPHFYYNFYVFQYATGFAEASFLAEKVVHGSATDRQNYLDYLKAGSSAYPLDVIAKAGVNMESTDYLESAFKLFEKRLNELEKLVEKGVHL